LSVIAWALVALLVVTAALRRTEAGTPRRDTKAE
jgi:hypothetical protein